jgi:hypothetical protein
MSNAEAELREQLTDAFGGADFPVENQMDLVPALPDGPSTTFTAGDERFSAMELSMKLGDHQDFPYDNVEDLVDDVVAGLKAEGLL